MGFRSSIGTNGTIGTNRVTRHSIGTLLVKCISLRAFFLEYFPNGPGFVWWDSVSPLVPMVRLVPME